MKHRLNDLINVLHRPVEIATQSSPSASTSVNTIYIWGEVLLTAESNTKLRISLALPRLNPEITPGRITYCYTESVCWASRFRREALPIAKR